MDSNLIQWPRAKYWTAQWNPIIGCKPCSPACENCYAAAWAKRFGQSFEPHESSKVRPPRKGVVFCGNMTDLFGEWNDSPLDAIGATAKKANADATYLYLTKRVHPMSAMLSAIVMGCPYTDPEIFSNHYFGFTAENQEWYAKRVAEAVNMPKWANRWLSAEPLIGAINLTHSLYWELPFKWVVVGCESGSNRRPCKIEWVESIVEQCMDAKIPVFVKQLDINGRCVTDINRFPAHLRIRQVPWAKENQP